MPDYPLGLDGIPDFAAVMGDTEANLQWITYQFAEMERRFDRVGAGPVRPVLHVGDVGIGYTGSGTMFTEWLNDAAAAHGLQFRMTDGNHDDHALLKSWDDGYPPLCPAVRFIPRNTRWEWHGRTWHAIGGAVSPNRAASEWDEDEMISDAEFVQAKLAGPADVMFTHDAPAGIPFLYGPRPRDWAAEDLELSDWHRRALADVGAATQPDYWIHGHHHMGTGLWEPFTLPGGKECKGCSLTCYGSDANWRLLNLRDMKLW